MPDDKHVSKPDSLRAQEDRCRKFCQLLNIRVTRCYRDQGNMHPVIFLPAIRSLLEALARSDEGMLVVSDHPVRLGLISDTRKNIINKIEAFGGQYLATHINPALYIENITFEIAHYLKGKE